MHQGERRKVRKMDLHFESCNILLSRALSLSLNTHTWTQNTRGHTYTHMCTLTLYYFFCISKNWGYLVLQLKMLLNERCDNVYIYRLCVVCVCIYTHSLTRAGFISTWCLLYRVYIITPCTYVVQL